MRAVVSKFKNAFKAPSLYAIWAAASLLVAYAGPFGTYDHFGFATRLVFWAAVVGFSIVAGLAIRVWIQHRDDMQGSWKPVLIGSFLVAVLLALPLTFLDRVLPLVPPLHELAVIIFVIAVSVSTSRHLLADVPLTPERPPEPARATPPQPEAAPYATPRLLERVAPDMRAAVYRVSVDDHYVRLVTERGEAELLMRFSDALKELDGADGMQVHRSHWVARNAVNGHRIRNNRLFLLLADGAEVPVSRSFRKPVEATLLPGPPPGAGSAA